MMQLSNLLGQDAVAIGTAARTGTVKGVGIGGSQIVSVELSDTTIPAAAVRSFEGQVAIVGGDLPPPTGPPVA